MTSTNEVVRTYLIEGQEVRCYEDGAHRLWRCECAAFQKRLGKFGEGFCAHTAVAIMQHAGNIYGSDTSSNAGKLDSGKPQTPR